MNVRMADLRKCVEALGFMDVRTVLSSGNVVFTGTSRAVSTLAGILEAGMAEHLPRSFPVMVRRVDKLAAMIVQDPYSGFRVRANEKRVVTFLGAPHAGELSLPIRLEGGRILAIEGTEVFSVCEPGRRGSGLLRVVEKTFGKRVTTRTLDTVRKCVAS